MGELGEHRSRSSLLSIPVLDTKTSGGSEYRESDGSLDLQSTLFEDHWLQSSQATTERNTDDPEEEIPPEEMVGEELPEVSNLEDSLRRDLEVEVVGMSHLSINERTTPTTSSAKCRKKKNHRLLELAKPKFNWQCLKDRTGRCCKGHVWISPRKTNLQFCLYWPSVYWTERFIEDTTLTITVPEVSRRVEELSRPKRFYQEYYNNNRLTHPRCILGKTMHMQLCRGVG
nr:testicular haploid expressed gene protein isoform X3 [Rattus norvegicus]